MAECDHGWGPIAQRHHAIMIVYTRPWWRGFRKTNWRFCRLCDFRERV